MFLDEQDNSKTRHLTTVQNFCLRSDSLNVFLALSLCAFWGGWSNLSWSILWKRQEAGLHITLSLGGNPERKASGMSPSEGQLWLFDVLEINL